VSSRLLYLNTHRLSAYRWQQGKLRCEGVFNHNDEGFRLFADYLAGHASSQFSLLANVAEEGHALETIPFLQGADRQTLITRKIGQHFLGTSLAAAISLGYEKRQRKNEKLLLSALTNPAHFEPWLGKLGEAEVALVGIYTVAQWVASCSKSLARTAAAACCSPCRITRSAKPTSSTAMPIFRAWRRSPTAASPASPAPLPPKPASCTST
jgi:hypothetical protein